MNPHQIIWPDDCDDHNDRQILTDMIEGIVDHEGIDGPVILHAAIFIVEIFDEDGNRHYRVYRPTTQAVLSEHLGLMEMAKVDLIDACRRGVPDDDD